MKRRQFLKGASVGVGAVAASVAAPAVVSAQESLNWRMVMPWPKGTPGLGTNAEWPTVRRITGRVKIRR